MHIFLDFPIFARKCMHSESGAFSCILSRTYSTHGANAIECHENISRGIFFGYTRSSWACIYSKINAFEILKTSIVDYSSTLYLQIIEQFSAMNAALLIKEFSLKVSVSKRWNGLKYVWKQTSYLLVDAYWKWLTISYWIWSTEFRSFSKIFDPCLATI